MTSPVPDELAPSVVGGKVTDVAHVRGATPDTDERLGTITEVSPAGVSSRVATMHRPIADVDTLAALRVMMVAGVYPEQVRLKCHTTPGVGGGIYTRSAVGSYVDDNGATIVDANWAYLLPEKDVSLHSFGADITGVALCDTAIGNYLACVAAREFGVFYWGPGQFAIADTVRFNHPKMFGLCIRGSGGRQESYGGGGTRIRFYGTAPDDVLASEQPRQTFEDLEILVADGRSARCGIRWQTSEIPIVGSMTGLRVLRCSIDGSAGNLVDAVACCPDSAHQAEYNHDFLRMEDCRSRYYSHAQLANYNLTGQAYQWVRSRCYSRPSSATGSRGVYMLTGNCRSEDCDSTSEEIGHQASVWGVTKISGGGSEYTKYAYSVPWGATPVPLEWSNRRFVKAFPLTGDAEAIAADQAAGPRLWHSLLVGCTEGDPRLGALLWGNGRWPVDLTVINSVFPSTDPAYAHGAYSSASARVRINMIGCMGRGPLDYSAPQNGSEVYARHIRPNQTLENPWIFSPTDPQCRAHYTTGPSVVPTEADTTQVAQWRSASPLAQPMTRAPGGTQTPALIRSTRTGGNQIGMHVQRGMVTPGAGRMNPGENSFLIVSVVRLVNITAEQCIIGKCDFGGVTANNWQCLVTASSTLQLAWGNNTANRYPSSVQAMSATQKDYLLMWGLDRATSEVIYAVLREDTGVPFIVERQAITITDELFSNDADVYAGCNTAGYGAGMLPATAYFTHWSMYIMDRNADPYDGTTSLLSNKVIECLGYQMVREFSLAP